MTKKAVARKPKTPKTKWVAFSEPGATAGTGTSDALFVNTPDRMPEIHTALRRVLVASDRMDRWGKEYRHTPSDEAGREFHRAWVDTRAAVDALVKIEPQPVNTIATWMARYDK